MNAKVIPIITRLNGHEALTDPSEPLGALSEFYRAFNRRDFTLLQRNWVSSDDACMAHPLGGIRHGWADIREGYERIFRAAAMVSLEFYDYTIHCSGEMFYAIGREQGALRSDNFSLEVKFRTSRLFRFAGGRWHQVHHHGSIDNPELLLRYQAAIR